jgi:hypothetical protein
MSCSAIFPASLCLAGLILEEVAFADFRGFEFTSGGNFYALFGASVDFCFHGEGAFG